MLLYERQRDDSTWARLELVRDGDGLRVERDDDTRALVPCRVIVAIMRRYGRELDSSVSVEGDTLDLAPGVRLRRFRFRAGVDAEGRDYLALCEVDRPVIAALATTVAAALDHLIDAR